MSDTEAQIWELFEKLEDMERKLTAVTEQRDEALSDLAFSRDLYRLQTKTIDDVREQRDRLAEAIKSAGMLYVPNSGGPYQTGWKDAVNWINQQALAAVKGGSDE